MGGKHPLPIRRAAEILLRETVLSTARIAKELGLPHRTVQSWNNRNGLRPAMSIAASGALEIQAVPDTGDPPDRASLEMALHRQIARQIAGLDARLNGSPDGIDSARMLRDLGGLKRLLDELSVPVAAPAEGHVQTGEDEVLAMRAEIAQRYAAFSGHATAAQIVA